MGSWPLQSSVWPTRTVVEGLTFLGSVGRHEQEAPACRNCEEMKNISTESDPVSFH